MIAPHGGKLVERFAFDKDVSGLPSITVEDRYLNDCEMIAVGAFSPLTGFMNKEDAESVIETMHLSNGILFPVPVLLPVDNFEHLHSEVALKDSDGRVIAVLTVGETFTLDKKNYVKKVYGTDDMNHPGVATVFNESDTYVSGEIELIAYPQRDDINSDYYVLPSRMRELFKERNWKTVVAFQTRNPIHRAHEYIQKSALEFVDGLLVHPLVGATKKDDIPATVRMQCYETLIDHYYSKDNTMLSVLPSAMRYAGPREAVLHALVRQNYGCTHFIIGRDHAGVGDYYGTYEAQELLDSVSSELLIKPMKVEHTFYCKKCEHVVSDKTCSHKDSRIILSGTKVRSMLKNGEDLPVEFTRREVAKILMEWGQSN